MPKAKLQDLIGKTMTSVVVKKYDFDDAPDNEIVFTTTEGKRYHLYHEQDCCEQVTIDSIVGDINDLVGAPLLLADERSCYSEDIQLTTHPEPKNISAIYDDSYTWTFYTFATIKGYVDIRWYGSSNGYYSESVDFDELDETSDIFNELDEISDREYISRAESLKIATKILEDAEKERINLAKLEANGNYEI